MAVLTVHRARPHDYELRLLMAFYIDHKIHFVITEAYRTIAYQDGLYALGRTKPGKQVLTLAVLTQIKQAVRVPVVAIGGITADNLLALKNTGIDGIAVVSAIMNSADPAAATQEILSLWRK